MNRTRIWIPLTAMVLVILYGSLYPFHFSLPQKALFIRDVPFNLGSVRDIVINVIMYAPLGFLLGKALPGSPAGVFIGLATGFLLSASVEYLQSFDAGRFSTMLDLAMNTVGTGFGIGVASLVRLRGPVGITQRLERNPAAVGLIVFMVVSHLFPFFPRVHYAEWRQAAIGFVLAPFELLPILFNTVEWLGVWVLLTALLERKTAIVEFLVLLLSIPAGLVIAGQAPSWLELAGGLIALIIGPWWPQKKEQLAPWFWLGIAGRELMPFHFAAHPQAFQWVPFAAVIQSGAGLAAILLRKCFIYGAAIWMRRDRAKAAMFLLAGLLFVLEQVECYLPNRTPEITDSLMALLLGCGLMWEQSRIRQPSYPDAKHESKMTPRHA